MLTIITDGKKNVIIEPRVVSIFDSVILVPENGSVKIADPVDGLYVQDNKFILRGNGDMKLNEEVISGDVITHFTDGGNIIAYDDDNKNYYLSNISDISSQINLNVLFNNLKETQLGLAGAVPINKIEPYPFDEDNFVVMTGRALYTMSIDSLEIDQVDPSVTDFVIDGNEVLWIDDEGISNLSLVFGTHSLLFSLEELGIENPRSIGINQSGNTIAVLTGQKELIFLETNSGIKKVISKNADSFVFSPDGKAISFVDGRNTIRVYRLEEEEKTSLITLITLPGTLVDSMAWHRNNNHVFVKDSGRNLRFIEIDNNLPINEIVVGRNIIDFIYSDDDESLYFSSPSGIWQLQI